MTTVRIERVDITGLAEAMQYLNDVKAMLDKPTDGLIAATNAVATQWFANWIAEGGQYRRWKQLAQSTQEERTQMGYGAAHPILEREGSLLSTAIQFFIEANSPGSAHGEDVDAEFAINGQTATLSMSGKKVANQAGGGNLPARPFWYSEGRATQAAIDATAMWLEESLNA